MEKQMIRILFVTIKISTCVDNAQNKRRFKPIINHEMPINLI